MNKKINKKSLSPQVQKQIIQAQRNEVTAYHVYKKLARKAKNKKNSIVLNSIAEDQLQHYKTWMKYSGKEVEPSHWNIIKYDWLASIFGLSFALKLMKGSEAKAQINYNEIGKEIPETLKISKEENKHEKNLLELINNKETK